MLGEPNETNHQETHESPTPCVRCGYCCASIPCQLGLPRPNRSADDLWNTCRYLVFRHGEHACALFVSAEGDEIREVITRLAAIAKGCLFPGNPWRQNPNQNRLARTQED